MSPEIQGHAWSGRSSSKELQAVRSTKTHTSKKSICSSDLDKANEDTSLSDIDESKPLPLCVSWEDFVGYPPYPVKPLRYVRHQDPKVSIIASNYISFDPSDTDYNASTEDNEEGRCARILLSVLRRKLTCQRRKKIPDSGGWCFPRTEKAMSNDLIKWLRTESQGEMDGFEQFNSSVLRGTKKDNAYVLDDSGRVQGYANTWSRVEEILYEEICQEEELENIGYPKTENLEMLKKVIQTSLCWVFIG